MGLTCPYDVVYDWGISTTHQQWREQWTATKKPTPRPKLQNPLVCSMLLKKKVAFKSSSCEKGKPPSQLDWEAFLCVRISIREHSQLWALPAARRILRVGLNARGLWDGLNLIPLIYVHIRDRQKSSVSLRSRNHHSLRAHITFLPARFLRMWWGEVEKEGSIPALLQLSVVLIKHPLNLFHLVRMLRLLGRDNLDHIIQVKSIQTNQNRQE